MLLKTTALVKIGCTNSKYYSQLGYQLTTHTDSHGEHIDNGQFIEVKISDLQQGSSTLVDIKCDYCGKVFQKKYKDYIKSHTISQTDACKNCASKKNKHINNKNNRKSKKFIDLTGQVFGNLTVLSLKEKSQDNKGYIYNCLCSCGNLVNVNGKNLTSGRKTNCGCINQRIKDKTGNKYGRLLVTKMLNISKNGHPDFECLCECGNKVIVNSDCLRKNGGTKSCGCLNTEKRKLLGESKFQDLSGLVFGRLKVVGINSHPQKGLYLWDCECDCGNTTIVSSNALKTGNTKSCGCLHSETAAERLGYDLTNKRFGRVTALYKHKNNTTYNARIWHCKCDCGNEFDTPSSSLLSGHTKSCGCLQSELTSVRSIKNIVGEKFGKLTVLERYKDNTKDRKARWICLCECGNTSIHLGKDLRNGKIKSCGCEKSKGEYIISQFLLKNNYIFEKQKKFDDCRNILPLPFDFCIYENNNILFLCEYDGIQHYKPIKFNQNITDEDVELNFKHLKNRDKIKTNYCKDNNIPLLRIPYWEFDNIEQILIEYIDELHNSKMKRGA